MKTTKSAAAALGRPKANLDLSEEDLQDILGMYASGASNVEVKAFIYMKRGSFSNDLWDRWMREEPAFSETIKKGLLLSQAWWEQNGRINLCNREFSPVLWYMNMKNRFGWADKKEVKTDFTKESVLDAIREEG